MKTNRIRDDLIDIVFTQEMIEGERARLRDDPSLLDTAPQCTMISGYRVRLSLAAAYAAQRWAGNFIEIGCWQGGTTQHLLGVAEEYGRQVIAVDPWAPHPKVDREAYYQTFLETTRPWKDRLIVLRRYSQEPEVIERVRATELCFAFVDGEHTYPALSTDLDTVSHANIIAVDDIYYDKEPTHTFECRQAFWDFARKTGREMLWCPNMPEGYLIEREGT